MTEESKRFLEFNITNVDVLSKDGKKWIALKPICKALGLDYIAQYKNLREDPFLAKVVAIQLAVASDGRLRPMTCLPEFYLYGWLISTRSKSKGLKAYKQECFNNLYNYFSNSPSVST